MRREMTGQHTMKNTENVGVIASFGLVIAVVFGFCGWYSSQTNKMVDFANEHYVTVCDVDGICGFADK